MRSFRDGLIRLVKQDNGLIKAFLGAYVGSELTLLNHVPAGKYVYSNEDVLLDDGIGYPYLAFDGENIHVEFASPVIPAGYKDIYFEISATTFPDDAWAGILTNAWNDPSDRGDDIRINPDGQVWWISRKGVAGDPRFYIVGSTNICDGNRHKIRLLWDGTTDSDAAKLFVDEVLDGSAKADSTETIQGEHYLIMGESGTSTNYLNANLYKLLISDASGYIAKYLFQEGVGSTLLDSTGNGNDGTISGTVWESMNGQFIPSISKTVDEKELIVNSGGQLKTYGTDIKRYAGFVSSRAMGTW